MSDFGKLQLMKYGWTEGKGLGKDENGIVKAIKPKMKFDLKGVGLKNTDENWWQSVYNKASKNVTVDKDPSGVSVKIVDKSAKIFSKNEDLEDLQKKYRTGVKEFIKTSTIKDGHTVREDAVESKLKINFDNLMISDEELFKACGGRTAHKGARHGLKLNGKLARIAKQEEEQLSHTSDLAETNNNSTKKKKTRTKKKAVEKEEFLKDETIEKTEESTKKKEKKEKKRKRKEMDAEGDEAADDDKKEIAHLMNNYKSHKCQLTKHQRKASRKRITQLVEMLDKNFNIDEDEAKNEDEAMKKLSEGSSQRKKRIKLESQIEEVDDSDLVLQTSFPLFREGEDYLSVFKDLTFKRYEEQDPTKFYPDTHKRINRKAKKMDKLSDELDSMCSLDETTSRKKEKKKCKKASFIDFDDCYSKIDAKKLNSKIEKKKRKRMIKASEQLKKSVDKRVSKLKPICDKKYVYAMSLS
ncbi:G patch domain-containing protein 4 [Leptopilina heterotoma]|uniref:G patch domain-containing protein 4 n=1 Tax=Leptopilina heterotoma TaxID=63436 RepID=UPI001CA96B2D|nr:G patch domain-containing protein 4 [Leptopilina heterotoma]